MSHSAGNHRWAALGRAIRAVFGVDAALVYAPEPGSVALRCLELRRRADLRPVLVVGFHGLERVVSLPGNLLLIRHPYNYAYLWPGAPPATFTSLAALAPLRDELACRRHVERYGTRSGLLRVLAHDLRNAVARESAMQIREIVDLVSRFEELPAGVVEALRLGGGVGELECGVRLLRAMERNVERCAH